MTDTRPVSLEGTTEAKNTHMSWTPTSDICPALSHQSPHLTTGSTATAARLLRRHPTPPLRRGTEKRRRRRRRISTRLHSHMRQHGMKMSLMLMQRDWDTENLPSSSCEALWFWTPPPPSLPPTQSHDHTTRAWTVHSCF